MGKSTPQAPAAPDPYATAQAQAQFNRINQVTPFGSITFGGGPTGPGGGGQQQSGGGQMGGVMGGLVGDINQRYDQSQPGGGLGGGGGGGMPMGGNSTATMTLSPEMQRQFDLQNQITDQTLQQALQRQSQFDTSPIDFSGLPALQGGLNLSGLTPLDTNFDAASKRASDAIFGLGQGMLNPQFDREQERMEQRLADQGLTMGGEAYSRDTGDFRDSRNRAFNELAMQSVLAGNNEQGRLFGQSLAGRGQGLQELIAQMQMGNSARGQGMQEQIVQRGNQFNELASLLGMQQTQIPQLNNFFAPGAVDFLGAQGQNMAQQNANYQGQVSQNNAKTGALGSMGGSLMQGAGSAGSFGALFSDRRLKTDIERVGETNAGVPLYRYRYKAGGPFHIGVMADEAERVFPEAVITMDNGFKAVDYERVH